MACISKGLSRYEQIALLIAHDISTGVYSEDQKLSGRSILAGKFNVSPETIRKALSLLQAQQVVDVIPGSGVKVLSPQSAQYFIRVFQEYRSLEALEHRLTVLIKKRNKLNIEIERHVKDIVKFKADMLKVILNTENVSVDTGSLIIGKSLQEARLRTITGATVIAVRRKGRWLVSPGVDMLLEGGDVLLATGSEKAMKHLRRVAEEKQKQPVTGK